MPQMAGVQLADAVGRDWPGMPVILAMGYGELPAGADRKLLRLAKPFSEQDLVRTIEIALGSKGQIAETTSTLKASAVSLSI